MIDGDYSNGYREITLPDDKALDTVDFNLIPGGVITGRVTDQDGSPVPNELPTLRSVDDKGNLVPYTLRFMFEFGTDDRGIYRVYGLPAGRYVIGFGVNDGPDQGFVRNSVEGKHYFPLTFFPGVADEAKSKIIEVKAGSETTGIDISFAKKESSFSAIGRVIDADTGAALPNFTVSYRRVSKGTKHRRSAVVSEPTSMGSS